MMPLNPLQTIPQSHDQGEVLTVREYLCVHQRIQKAKSLGNHATYSILAVEIGFVAGEIAA